MSYKTYVFDRVSSLYLNTIIVSVLLEDTQAINAEYAFKYYIS